MPRKRSNELDDDELPLLSLTELYIVVAFGLEECHGYAIMHLVESDSSGALRLRPSTVYGAIKRMVEAGYLEYVPRERATSRGSNAATSGGARASGVARSREDARRRYYCLTPTGRNVSDLQLQLLERLLKRARARQVLRDFFATRAGSGK